MAFARLLYNTFTMGCWWILYSWYFLGGKIFMVFVVERQTTKFFPTKQYHIVLGCGLVYHNHKNLSTNWPKIHCSQTFYPSKNTCYMVPDCKPGNWELYCHWKIGPEKYSPRTKSFFEEVSLLDRCKKKDWSSYPQTCTLQIPQQDNRLEPINMLLLMM